MTQEGKIKKTDAEILESIRMPFTKELILFFEANELSIDALKRRMPNEYKTFSSLYTIKKNQTIADNILRINYKDGSYNEVNIFYQKEQ